VLQAVGLHLFAYDCFVSLGLSIVFVKGSCSSEESTYMDEMNDKLSY
jgi:hypothetical protein